MKSWLEQVDAAKKELLEKDLNKIQEETAYKWAARYAAAIELMQNEESDAIARLSWRDDAIEYYSEAVEHAAQVKDEMFYSTIRMLIGK
jgi:hypothetical protein